MIQANCRNVIVHRLRHGEDLLGSIENVANEAHVDSGIFLVIGALDKARLGFYTGEGGFRPTDIERQLEITSCIGNLADEDGRIAVHAHMTAVDSDGRVYGGHVLTGCRIYIQAELMIFQLEGTKLKRKIDKETALRVLQA